MLETVLSHLKFKIDVSFSCVCPVLDHEFRHNIVKVAVDPRGDSWVDPHTTVAHNCYIKTKCSQQITNRSNQIQIAHSKFKSLTANYKSLTANYKSLTANSNRPQQIQIVHSKLKSLTANSNLWSCFPIKKDIGCALSIMKSPHVILSHLHDMIASHHLLLHTQCPVAYLMSCCTTNVLLHTQYPIKHLMSCCTSNVLLHT